MIQEYKNYQQKLCKETIFLFRSLKWSKEIRDSKRIQQRAESAKMKKQKARGICI